MVSTRGWIAAWLALLVVALDGFAPARGAWVVDADFENGSAEVVSLDQETGTIRLRPAGDPRRGWPCWWSFKLRGLQPGALVTIEIDRTLGPLPSETGAGNEGRPLDPGWSQPRHAAYSLDGGKTWRQTPPGERHDGRMRYAARIDAAEAWFAWGPVFAVADATALIDRLVKEVPGAESFELARTHEGRRVPGLILRAGTRPDAERHGIWVQARQHAWEAGASWVGRGFIEWLVSDDPRAVALRERSLVYFVPVMDVDSVATGNGGKGQAPQDHNRDWSDAPHFPEVAAAQRRLRELDAAGRLDVFLDLHNPAPGDQRPFFFAAPEELLAPRGRENLARFIQAAEREITGPLVLDPRLRRSGANYSTKWREISKNWVALHCRPHVVALTLETAWNTPHGTTEGYLAVGRQLGLALEAYLRTSPRD